ncbi:MAG: hypothetical protein JXA15_04650 [Spirochaetales bacterium]|nr:hypothetical protein [Spirochaetales bacterium]
MPIKSALEIAMERTTALKADSVAIKANERRRDGKRLAGEFLAEPDAVDLKARLESEPKEDRNLLREGAYETLATRIQLPLSRDSDGSADLAVAAKGFAALATGFGAEGKVEKLFQQLQSFMQRFVTDADQLDQGLRRQFEPRLRQREQEAAARTGRAVRLDPMSDPEFVKVYQQQAGMLKAQYQQVLDKAKLELAGLLGVERKDDTAD